MKLVGMFADVIQKSQEHAVRSQPGQVPASPAAERIRGRRRVIMAVTAWEGKR